jgi:hypothetical protein
MYQPGYYEPNEAGWQWHATGDWYDDWSTLECDWTPEINQLLSQMAADLNPLAPESVLYDGGAGPGLAVTPDSAGKKSDEESACSKVRDQPGVVAVGYASLAGYRIAGGSASLGVFQNQDTGSMGFFWTLAGGIGLDAGGSAQGGVYASAQDLEKWNLNVNLSPVYGTVSSHWSLDGDWVGLTVGPAFEAGGTGTLSYTGFFGCIYNEGN